MTPWLRQAALPVIIAVIASLAFHQRWAAEVDVLLYDTLQPLLPKTEVTDSVVIAIDERSIAALGRWPWPRSVHASLLQLLATHHQARVYFDVLFVDPASSQDDALLAEAIAQHGQVFLAMSIEQVAQYQQLIELLPIPPLFAAANGVGHVHLDCEFDGICRSFYSHMGVGHATWPHLATLPAAEPVLPTPQFSNATGDLFVIKRNGLAYLPFHPEDSVKVVSYVDVLSGAIDPGWLKDKDLFIGATAPGVHDILSTPAGRMPGVVIMALLQHHVTYGGVITRWQSTYLPWSLGIACALLFIALSLLPPRAFLLSIVSLAALQCVIALLLIYFFQLWLPIAAYLIATLAFYPLWSWLRLELTLRHLQHQLANSPTHPLAPALAQRLSAVNHAGSTLTALNKDPMVKTIVDVETTTQTQFAAHELLERSVANLQEGCIIFDAQFRCQLVNTLVSNWLPLWPADTVLSLCQALYSQAQPLGQNEWASQLKHLMFNDGGMECEVTNTLEKGPQQKTFLLRAKRCPVKLPQLEQPIVLGIITLADISALKQSERQREETLNFVSHDLRSPLVSILALIKHWRETEQPKHSRAVEKSLIEQVEHYAHRNLSYTESLLQLNRAEQLVVDKNALCDLLAVCEDAVAQLTPQASAKDCPLSLHHDDQEFWVAGDYELLQRALVNLIGNAIKYAASPSGIEVHLKNEGQHILVTVVDYGPGMNAEQLAQAFERFSRAPTHQEGAGLGLYFVKQVIERHSGTITLNSKPVSGNRIGCAFICALPSQDLDFLP